MAGMADEVQALLNQAMRFGTKIPEFMRPLLQMMINAGLLTDEFGNKLTDLSQFSFTDSIESSFEKMRKILEQIRDLLAYGIPGAIKALPDLPPRWVPPGDGDSGGAIPRATAMPMLGSDTTQMTGWNGDAGMVVPTGGDTYTIHAIDARSFETFLRDGGNRAVMRTLPLAVSGAGLTR